MIALSVAAAIIAVPAIAFAAASTTFTSNTLRSAVTGVNTSALNGATGITGQEVGGGANQRTGVSGAANGTGGIGVSGSGTKYGVYSNGPLGVAQGKKIVCTGCITEGDIGTLPPGKSESGLYAGGTSGGTTGYIGVAINYPVPLATAIADSHVYDASANGYDTDCPAYGTAAPGWLCLYGQVGDYEATLSDIYSGPADDLGSPSTGVILYYEVNGTEPYVGGTWTVTAP